MKSLFQESDDDDYTADGNKFTNVESSLKTNFRNYYNLEDGGWLKYLSKTKIVSLMFHDYALNM